MSVYLYITPLYFPEPLMVQIFLKAIMHLGNFEVYVFECT